MPDKPRKRSVREPRIDYDGRSLVASHGPHVPVRSIIHDTESHDEKGVRDLAGVANFWHNQRLPDGRPAGYGAQRGIDKKGNSARYVDDDKVAYHTGGRNTGSLGTELIGFAFFTRLVWWVKRTKQMHKLAKWMAYDHKEYGIPLVWDVEKGFSTHRMQSRHFPDLTNHTDPGAFFPKKRVMKLARHYAEDGWE